VRGAQRPWAKSAQFLSGSDGDGYFGERYDDGCGGDGMTLEVTVFEIVGNPLCFASGDGQKVHDRLAVALKEGRSVTLSFHNVTIVTATFLNTAIGQLYGEFNADQIRTLLRVRDMQADDVMLLKRVVETAKQYFADLKGRNIPVIVATP